MRTRSVLLLALAAAPMHFACAQAFPSKPIRVVCSVPLGSSGDTALRLMTSKMGPAIGQPLVIETSTAAGGTVAARGMMKAPADGYAFLYASSGSMVGAVYLTKNLGYDTPKDFTAISQVAEGGSFLAVSASLPLNSVKELVDYALRNPGKLSYGSNGFGSNFHMQGEAFKMAAGIDLLHVPYSGGNMAIPVNDLLTGRLDIHFPSFSLIGPHLSTGKVKLIGVMGARPVKRMPDVPLVKDVLPGFKPLPSWFGAFGPPGMPPALTARLQAEMAKALAEPDVSGKLNDIGITPWGSTPEAFAAALKTDLEIMGQLVAKLGIQPQ
jgi:tripartite-type tricarboxylate transporter receptor subunit TctC